MRHSGYGCELVVAHARAWIAPSSTAPTPVAHPPTSGRDGGSRDVTSPQPVADVTPER
jgi:hypothetical protein